MKRHILLGKAKKGSGYQPGCQITLRVEITATNGARPMRTVDLESIGAAEVLKMSGYVWNLRRSDAYSCGQNRDEIKMMCGLNPRVRRLIEIWDRWHFNDMRIGTRAQQAAIDAHEAENPDWRYDYTEACRILADEGLLVDRGHKYGSAWLVEPLPAEVREELEVLTAQFPEFVR